MPYRCLPFVVLALSLHHASAQTVPAQPSASPAPKHKVFLRSGEVITCHVGEDCTEETIAGLRYYVLDVDGYKVKAAIDIDQRTSHADITIVNETANRLQLIPAEFRIEIIQPQYKRLSYVDPKRLAVKKKSQSSKGLPPPSYFTSEKHLKEKQKDAANAPVPPLPAKVIAPSETVAGRVYFDHPPSKATSMNLVVPLSGALFEFPYDTSVAVR